MWYCESVIPYSLESRSESRPFWVRIPDPNLDPDPGLMTEFEEFSIWKKIQSYFSSKIAIYQYRYRYPVYSQATMKDFYSKLQSTTKHFKKHEISSFFSWISGLRSSQNPNPVSVFNIFLALFWPLHQIFNRTSYQLCSVVPVLYIFLIPLNDQ